MTDWLKSQRKAAHLLEKYDVTEPPVNAFQLAADEGIEIVFFSPTTPEEKEVSGLLDAATKKIYLNVEELPERQTFTIAHELGHLELEHEPNEYGAYKRNALWEEEGKPDAEKEADKFASELLMPKKLINDTMKKYGLTKSDAGDLAKIFGVSVSAMKYRLKNI